MRLTSLSRRLALGLILTLAVTLAWAPAAAADTLLKMKHHSDAAQMMGQTRPAQDLDITFWVGDQRAMRSDGKSSVILRPDQKKLYVVNHGAKTYSVLDLPVDIMSYFPPEMKAQMDQMMQAMQMTATVEPTDETKTINGWNTRLYHVTLSSQMGITVNSQVWVTKDVDVDLAAFKEMTRALASMQPGAAAAADELLKIDGVPVLAETEITGMGGGGKQTEELVSATTQKAPPGTYEVPEGYTEQPFTMGQGAGQ